MIPMGISILGAAASSLDWQFGFHTTKKSEKQLLSTLLHKSKLDYCCRPCTLSL